MDKFLELFSLETGTLVPMVISIALSLLILAVGIRLINRFFRRARERTLASAHPELASVLPALRGVLTWCDVDEGSPYYADVREAANPHSVMPDGTWGAVG